MIYNDLQWFTMIYHDLPINLNVMFQFANAWVDELPPQLELWDSENQGCRPIFSWGITPQKKFQYYINLYKMVSWMCLGVPLVWI